jgi:hypothetical protein
MSQTNLIGLERRWDCSSCEPSPLWSIDGDRVEAENPSASVSVLTASYGTCEQPEAGKAYPDPNAVQSSLGDSCREDIESPKNVLEIYIALVGAVFPQTST